MKAPTTSYIVNDIPFHEIEGEFFISAEDSQQIEVLLSRQYTFTKLYFTYMVLLACYFVSLTILGIYYLTLASDVFICDQLTCTIQSLKAPAYIYIQYQQSPELMLYSQCDLDFEAVCLQSSVINPFKFKITNISLDTSNLLQEQLIDFMFDKYHHFGTVPTISSKGSLQAIIHQDLINGPYILTQDQLNIITIVDYHVVDGNLILFLTFNIAFLIIIIIAMYFYRKKHYG